MGFFELLLVDRGGRVHHEVDAGAVFGEGDDISDVVLIFENHENTIEPWGAAGVRRSTKLEGV